MLVITTTVLCQIFQSFGIEIMSLLLLILGLKVYLDTMATTEYILLPWLLPFDETHFDVVRGFILTKRF